MEQKVCCRYITVKLIEVDNRMEEFGDEHPAPNFDIQDILFTGEIIPSQLVELK